MPAQSGSTSVLERMRRGYTREAYARCVGEARARGDSGVALSSDFIAGFCGETEEEHADTVALMREMRYEHAFMFAYSMREKTAAARADGRRAGGDETASTGGDHRRAERRGGGGQRRGGGKDALRPRRGREQKERKGRAGKDVHQQTRGVAGRRVDDGDVRSAPTGGRDGTGDGARRRRGGRLRRRARRSRERVHALRGTRGKNHSRGVSERARRAVEPRRIASRALE